MQPGPVYHKIKKNFFFFAFKTKLNLSLLLNEIFLNHLMVFVPRDKGQKLSNCTGSQYVACNHYRCRAPKDGLLFDQSDKSPDSSLHDT